MSDLSTGKSILICGIILSCFAVLWPKIFHPMLFGSNFFPGKNELKETLRQERRADLHPEYTHPAFRERGKLFYGEEGRQIKRSIDKDMRSGPGPVPGMRPTFGGPGMPTPAPRSQGSMGVLMPMYTIGIIVFFVYTTMKIIFKKNDDPMNEPLYSRKTLGNSGVEELTDSASSGYSGDDYLGNSLYITKKINANVETLHQEIHGREELAHSKGSAHQLEGHSIAKCTDAACQQLNNAKIMTDKTENLLMGTQKVTDSRDPRDIEINLLRQRLEETEKAMERIMAQMGGLVQKTSSPSEESNPLLQSEEAEQKKEELQSEEGSMTTEENFTIEEEDTQDDQEEESQESKKDK